MSEVTRKVNRKKGFPGDSAVKNPPANAGDLGLIPGLGRSPGGRNGNPLQHYCLENPMDRGASRLGSIGWQKSQTWLRDSTTTTRKKQDFGAGSNKRKTGLQNFLLTKWTGLRAKTKASWQANGKLRNGAVWWQRDDNTNARGTGRVCRVWCLCGHMG